MRVAAILVVMLMAGSAFAGWEEVFVFHPSAYSEPEPFASPKINVSRCDRVAVTCYGTEMSGTAVGMMCH